MQRGCISVGYAGHEIAEQQTEKNQPKHLPFSRRGNDIGGHHTQKNRRQITRPPAFDFLHQVAGILGQTDQIARRFTVDDARLNGVDYQQPDQDGQQTGGCVVKHRLAAKTAQRAPRTDPGNAHNDRRDDQRHDQHFQGIEKQRAKEIENSVKRHAENGGFGTNDTADHDSQAQCDEDLPVQF